MPIFEIETQQGTFEVDAPDERAALRALSSQQQSAAAPAPDSVAQEFADFASSATQNPAAAQYDELPAWQKPIVATSDILQLAGSSPMLGFGEKLVAGGRSLATGKSYEDELAEQRRLTTAARKRSGWAGTAAELAGGVKGGMKLAEKGLTLAGRFGTAAVPGLTGAALRTSLMGAEGAGYGLAGALGNDTDLLQGIGVGALAGLGGGAAGELASKLGERVSRAWQYWKANPTDKAKTAVFQAAREAGIDSATANRLFQEMGPDAMVVDVLGKHGTSLGRKSANLSPEARETLESAVLGRKAGQNERIVGTLEDIAGLPAGTRKTVKELQQETYRRQAPAINAAYNEARAAGFDLPRTPFSDVLNSPMGKAAYEEAAASLKNRAAVDGMDAASELARLDETKKILDAKANVAYRNGDNNTGEQAAGLAKKLREAMDASIAGPEYAKARGLRQNAYRSEEAIQTGADLARSRVPANLPAKARKTGADDLVGLRQGYALQQAENLLNRGSTEGALNTLSTPLAREAYEAALGDRAADLARRLKTERAFNSAARDLTGNSSTARQLVEAAGGTVGGGILGLLTGQDPTSLATVGGLLGAGRRYIPAVQRTLATKGQKAIAPEVAEILTRRSIPASYPIPPGILERLSKTEREALARALAILGIGGTAATQR